METEKCPPSEQDSRDIQGTCSSREQHQVQQAYSSPSLGDEEGKERQESSSGCPQQEERNPSIAGTQGNNDPGDTFEVRFERMALEEKPTDSERAGAGRLTQLLLDALDEYIKKRKDRGTWKLESVEEFFRDWIKDGEENAFAEHPFDSLEHLEQAFRSELRDSVSQMTQDQAGALAGTVYTCLQREKRKLAGAAPPQELVSPLFSDGRSDQTPNDTSTHQISSETGINTPTFLLLRRLAENPEQASNIEVPDACYIAENLTKLRREAQDLLQNRDTSNVNPGTSNVNPATSNVSTDMSRMNTDVPSVDPDASNVNPDTSNANSDASNVNSDASNVYRGFEQLFVRVWEFFATLSEFDHPWAMPPPYRTAQVETYMNRTAKALVLCELGKRRIGTNDILHGVKGVGKTTLLQITGLVTAVLCNRAVPIYWNYEMEKFRPTLFDLLLSARECRRLSVEALAKLGPSSWCSAKEKDRDTVSDAVSAFRSYVPEGMPGTKIPRWSPVLLLDEFTKLYCIDNSRAKTENREDVIRGKHIMEGLQAFGKYHKNVVVALAASTSGIKRYVEPVRGGIFEGYPNLNNSVYVRRHVLPIRKPLEMKEYVLSRHNRKIDEEQALKLLSTTGGIGRFVATKFTDDPQDIDNLTIPLSTPSVHDILGDRLLFAVAVELLSEYPGDHGADVWYSWGIPYNFAVKTLVKSELSDDEARQKIEGWIDASFFIVIENRLEFVFPHLGRQLDQAINLNEDYTLAKVLLLTLKGIKGGSMGHSNESLICRHLPKHLQPPASAGHTDSALVFAEDGSVAWNNASSDRTPIVSVHELAGLLCAWRVGSCETGIDRIWPIETSSDVFDVYGMQLKTGQIHMATTPGQLATQRGMPKVSNMDDTCIAGLLAKAERGFSRLMPALRKAFPRVTFNVGGMTFYTTKASASAAADQFRANHAEHACALVVADRHLKNMIFGRGRSNVIPWRVVAGTGWLREVLPTSVKELVS